MKFWVTLIFYCSIVVNVMGVTDEMKELIATLHKTCVAEIGIDEAVITKVNTEKVLPDDEKLKCYMKCLMDQTGCIDDEGKIDVEAMIALVPDEMKADVTPTIKKCGSKVDANPCDSVWLTHQCYLENDPDRYFLI